MAATLMAGPRWVRLDVDYFHNPKVVAAGRNGRDLHLASICWVARYLTDGHIPGDIVPLIAGDAGISVDQRARAVERAVVAGLWIPTERDYYLKDFTEMNGSRADAEREREQWRLRKVRQRSRPRHGETGA
jgi:hypothetical protein